MKKFQTLVVHSTQERLVHLLNQMKTNNHPGFIYQKKLSEDYARNIFVDISKVACFKTKRKSLFESCIWVLVQEFELRITNITSQINHNLGISNYNIVLNAFYTSVIQPLITQQDHVNISDEVQSLADMLDPDTFRKLALWETACNKSMPIAHRCDYERWLDFVISASVHRSELSPGDLSQWLKEDKAWPMVYEEKIAEVSSLYEYGRDLLSYYNENR